MNSEVYKFLDFVEKKKDVNNKLQLIELCVNAFHLVQDRKVYHSDYFAVRFCYTQKGSFPNTVLSLSSLEKYDRIPFFVVLVKANSGNRIFISNSTFLSKISHSSQKLTLTNIRGSFNGSDIVKQYEGIENIPENFEKLYSIHDGMDWIDNLQRLVDASSEIQPISTKFIPNEEQLSNIRDSVKRAQQFVCSNDYKVLLDDLQQRCEDCKESILVAAHIENVNIRGRLIEALITSDKIKRLHLLSDLANIEHALPTYDIRNGLGDYIRHFSHADSYVDIKTKIVYLHSNPKMYNIDKFLQCMAEKNSVFLFFFVGLGEYGIEKTTLCSVFHPMLLNSMHLQEHWAGRSTRGVAQASGDAINKILDQPINEVKQFNIEDAEKYIKMLLDR